MEQNKTKILGLRLGVFFFIFLGLIFSVCATSYYGVNYTIVFQDDYEYTDTLASHNYTVTFPAGCTNNPLVPFNFANVTGGTLALGFNKSVGACSSGTASYQRTQAFGTLYSNSILDFDYYVGSDHTNGTQGTYLTLRCGSNNNAVTYSDGYNPYDNTQNITVNPIGRTGSASCIITGVSRGAIHNLVTLMNYNTNSYSVFLDNSEVCSTVAFGTDSGSAGCIQGLFLQQRINSGVGQISDRFLDNIIIATTNTNASLFLVNQPCVSNANCSTGYCSQGLCALKLFNMDCTTGAECQSGRCTNGKCESPTLSENLNLFKNQFFGADSVTSNIISIILMVGIALAFAFALHKVPIAAALGSISVFYVLGFLFAMIGWLSAWIVFAMILLLIVGIVGMIILGSRSSQGGG